MPVYVDQLGREICIASRPTRIVSLVPSQTELLYDLGLEEEVAGITKFCIHPEKWFRRKTRIGGTKNLAIEKIRLLQPDLIIANKEENVADQVTQLMSIAPVWTSDIATLEDALDMIRQIGIITGTENKAGNIIAQLTKDFAAIEQRSALQPKRRAAYLIWKDPWMTVGGDTFISDILQRTGFQNVFADMSRYPEISLDDISQRRAELLLLSSEPYPFKEIHLQQVASALQGITVQLVDGEMFSWYGSRLLQLRTYLDAVSKT